MKVVGMILFIVLEMIYGRGNFMTNLPCINGIVFIKGKRGHLLHEHQAELRLYNSNLQLLGIVLFNSLKHCFKI